MINIVFMGTPDYAKMILQTLINDNDINISLVLTQPDRPYGRKRELKPTEVKVLANEYNLKYIQPQTLKNIEVINSIKNAKPDFIIVAAYGQLLPKEILEIAPCINLHASILPKYRGASPIQQALLNGDEYSGVTAMLMDEGLDSGDILGFRYVKTKEAPTKDLMFSKLAVLASSLTINVIKEFDNILPIPQINALSSKCKKIHKQDGLVDFKSAQDLYRKYCAYYQNPHIYLENKMKLYDVELLDTTSINNEGEILEVENEKIIVGCKKGTLRIGKVQPPSKKSMSAKSYTLGKRIKVGDTLLW